MHDITFDPASSLQQRNDVDALVDFRTPSLDLDSLYGSGPDDQPYIYTGNGRKFQLGRDLFEGPNGRVIAKDLPRRTWTEDGKKYHRALIGDKRNDENVIVAQLHSVFLQFHNRLADQYQNWDFAEIRQFNNLALRNLLRGQSMGLPSGQDIARAMGYKPLKDEELKVGKATTADEYDNLPILPSIHTDFIGKAPLWYYVLAEAAHDWRCKVKGGEPDAPVNLGQVSSRIVLETLVGLLLDDSHSFLRQAPAWTPEIGKKEQFDMPDLINYALGL